VEPGQGAWFLRPSRALPRRDGGLWIVPLLGARDPGVGARSGLDSSRVHETLRQARQERCERRGCDLRGHVAPRHAVRADQERGSASRADAAQDPGIAGQQRTMTVNALRGHLSEFGLIAPKGIHRVKELLALALADETLPEEAKQASAMLASHSGGLDEKIDDLEKTIAQETGKKQRSQLLDAIPALGPLIASKIPALIPDPSVFRSGSDFSASLGITPSQHSSGGKDKLGAITKKGNRYLCKMLVVGCTSVLRVAHKHKGALAEWIVAMRARKPERVVAVALANKLARIAWAMMSTGESFRTELYTKA